MLVLHHVRLSSGEHSDGIADFTAASHKGGHRLHQRVATLHTDALEQRRSGDTELVAGQQHVDIR
jgi:hypothetical protein